GKYVGLPSARESECIMPDRDALRFVLTERSDAISRNLGEELRARTGLSREDYGYSDLSRSSPHSLFWSAYRPLIFIYEDDYPDYPGFLSEQEVELTRF